MLEEQEQGVDETIVGQHEQGHRDFHKRDALRSSGDVIEGGGAKRAIHMTAHRQSDIHAGTHRDALRSDGRPGASIGRIVRRKGAACAHKADWRAFRRSICPAPRRLTVCRSACPSSARAAATRPWWPWPRQWRQRRDGHDGEHP